jgi:hypothetical protein
MVVEQAMAMAFLAFILVNNICFLFLFVVDSNTFFLLIRS